MKKNKQARTISITWKSCIRSMQAAMILLLAFSILVAFPSAAYAAGATFTLITGAGNDPFNNVDVGDYSAPSFVDIDGDGDMDAFIGEEDGTLNYYQNSGTPLAPAFTLITGTGNDPFDGVDVGVESRPSFVDVDGDGDMDAFIGEEDGTLNYYQNSGTPLAPAFTLITGGNDPFDGVDVGGYSVPSFVDVDGDGDMDAFIGESNGTLNYYRNSGTPLAPAFTLITGGNDPFDGMDVGHYSTPSFVDVDGDGDMDAFIGESDGNLNYYRNSGTPLAPVFTLTTGTGNDPFDGMDVGTYSAPSFVDVDGDGDMDAFIGESDGNLNYYQNSGTNTVDPDFVARTGAGDPFDSVDVGVESKPSFVDVDGDGDMDAFIGEYSGNLNYYRNSGTPLAPVFTLTTGTGNDPFHNVDVGVSSAPSFVDVDGDGDMDAFIGESNGNLNYYQNSGTPLAPVFTHITGAGNPFDSVDVGLYSAPSFVDVDGDGDMDAFIGEHDGTLNYYQNSGTPLAPVFTLTTGAGNPFDGVDVGEYSAPSFVDVDGDGDMDAFIGEYDGNLNYYQNSGTPLAPVFTLITGGNDPFDGVDVGFYSVPSFVDVDGDGDMDAFIGENDGNLNYYENTHCSFTSESSGALAVGETFHFGNGNSRVTVKVNSLGNPALTNITVACNAGNHASATANMTAGAYWTITPSAGAGGTTPFDLDLTMPFKSPVSGEDRLCRYTGGAGYGWECEQSSFTATTITQSGVQALSDWTVGDNVGPTAVSLQSITATNNTAMLPVLIATLMLLLVGGVALRRRSG